MKKIIFLGAAYPQIPIIQEAKRRGWYVITCDYLPENPGHTYADEYHNVSTTDADSVLQLAKKVKPDYVVAYASDPAAPTAAYVSEELGLPGNTYQSVRLLSEKDLFRNLLKENGFRTPDIITLSQNSNLAERIRLLSLPLIVKPNDSSGSKGVSKVENPEELENATQHALTFSRQGKIIVEEFIDNEQADLHGDGFIVDGNLVFSCIGDHVYNGKSNPYNPVGTLWPTKISSHIVQKIEEDVAGIIDISGFKNGPVNIEARINSEGHHFIMEIGPRNGGHFVPQAIKYATGFDLVKATLDNISGKEIVIPELTSKYSAYYAIHSDVGGTLKRLSINKKIKTYIREFHQYISIGNKVKLFQGANAAIGIVLFDFPDRQGMNDVINNINEFINLEIETD